MFGAVIRALIYICCIALAFYLIVWVLGEIGIVLPAMVMHIVMVIFVLFALLILWQLFSPWIGGFDWWGRGPGNPAIIIALGAGLVLSTATPLFAHERHHDEGDRMERGGDSDRDNDRDLDRDRHVHSHHDNGGIVIPIPLPRIGDDEDIR